MGPARLSVKRAGGPKPGPRPVAHVGLPARVTALGRARRRMVSIRSRACQPDHRASQAQRPRARACRWSSAGRAGRAEGRGRAGGRVPEAASLWPLAGGRLPAIFAPRENRAASRCPAGHHQGWWRRCGTAATHGCDATARSEPPRGAQILLRRKSGQEIWLDRIGAARYSRHDYRVGTSDLGTTRVGISRTHPGASMQLDGWPSARSVGRSGLIARLYSRGEYLAATTRRRPGDPRVGGA